VSHLRAVLALALLSVSLACSPPPRPDGGPPPIVDPQTPATWVDTTRLTIERLHWVLPAIDQIIAAQQGLDPMICAGVHRAVEAVTVEILPACTRALDVYAARNPPRCREARAECCQAFRAIGALKEALVGLARALVRSGWATAVDIVRGLNNIGVVEDDLAGTCDMDAGWTSYRAALEQTVRSIETAAISSGAVLRPFPAVLPQQDRGAP